MKLETIVVSLSLALSLFACLLGGHEVSKIIMKWSIIELTLSLVLILFLFSPIKKTVDYLPEAARNISGLMRASIPVGRAIRIRLMVLGVFVASMLCAAGVGVGALAFYWFSLRSVV